MIYRLPANPTPEQLNAAYGKGLLRKEELKHGVYYLGRCRNATVARWHAGAQVFVYWREKFGSKFLSKIKHPLDEPVFDVFLAREETTPSEPISDDEFEEFVRHYCGGDK